MSSINSDEIISILKSEIENFDEISKDSEVGTVVTVGDGIATITESIMQCTARSLPSKMV